MTPEQFDGWLDSVTNPDDMPRRWVLGVTNPEDLPSNRITGITNPEDLPGNWVDGVGWSSAEPLPEGWLADVRRGDFVTVHDIRAIVATVDPAGDWADLNCFYDGEGWAQRHPLPLGPHARLAYRPSATHPCQWPDWPAQWLRQWRWLEFGEVPS